jgi:hypothetical protein
MDNALLIRMVDWLSGHESRESDRVEIDYLKVVYLTLCGMGYRLSFPWSPL